MRHDCVGALLVRGGRVLLGLRAPDAAWLADAWDIFGGHVEAGETGEAAIRRELEEELGIRAGPVRALGELAGDAPEPWRLRVFAIHEWQGDPDVRVDGSHVAMQWCSLDEARARLAPAHPGFAPLLEAALAPGAASMAAEPDPDPGSPA
jgi:8-oxo-dGTP diphosphatase